MSGHFLVHTIDSNLWRTEIPKLYLGTWSLPNNFADNKYFSVVDPYGLDKLTMDHDFQNLRKIKANVFLEFCEILNDYNNVSYDSNFWNLCLGHWFDRISRVVLNRHKTLLKCFADFDVSECPILSTPLFNKAPPNTLMAVHDFDTPLLNSMLNSFILKELGIPKLKLKRLRPELEQKFIENHQLSSVVSKSSYWKKVAQRVADRISRSDVMLTKKILIYKPYLPLSSELLLSFSLLELPFYMKVDKGISSPLLDVNFRESAHEQLIDSQSDDTEMLIRKILFQLIPVCYLEGFKQLNKEASGIKAFKNSRLIFTANGFDFDECFKLSAAKAKLRGAKYFVCQHGANYGSLRYDNPTVEEQTADKFFTWGKWKKELDLKYVQLFIVTIAGKKFKRKQSSLQNVVLMQEHRVQRMHSYDTWALHERNLESQFELLNLIEADMLNQFCVRLHPYDSQVGSFDEIRWSKEWPSLQIDLGQTPVLKVMEKCKLMIFTYNSTGFLESMALNVPTIALWKNDKLFLRDEVISDYEHLERAGILFDDPLKAATHLKNILDNVDKWWLSDKTQAAVSSFCDKYTKKCSSPVKTLRQELKRVF